MVGDGVGLLGSCDHGLLFMFDCDFLGCICLMRVLVWCVVVPRLGLSVLWSRGECGYGMIRCVRSRRFTLLC